MGDAKSIKLDPECKEQPKNGKTNLRCEFSSASGWGGVAWTSTIGGHIVLGGTLTQLRLTTSNGTDTFDAGSANVFYE